MMMVGVCVLGRNGFAKELEYLFNSYGKHGTLFEKKKKYLLTAHLVDVLLFLLCPTLRQMCQYLLISSPL